MNPLVDSGRWERLANTPYLSIIRSALTLTLPVVIAGAIAVLINNFPIQSYQNFMVSVFGEGWRMFGGYVWNGTLSVLSPIMVFTIGHSIAEHYNAKHPLDAIHPVIVGLVAFCALLSIIEPAREVYAIPYRWVGIHGLFLSLIVAVASSDLFLRLYRFEFLRIRFFSEDANTTISSAFFSLFPGLLTIFAFAGIKVVLVHLGVYDIHGLFYSLLYKPFQGLGNTLATAMLYNLMRHMLWFFGVHGSNALEPIMTEIYVGAAQANAIAEVAGEPIPYIFTKTFFDTYISIGGAGSTLALLLACFFSSRQSSLRKIAQISAIPAIFNINETLLFGLPIVLNPVFLIPFILTPLALTLTAYCAILWGLTPHTTTEVAWTTPFLISGYVATGSIAGSALQLVNVMIGVLIYMPFVRISEELQRKKFEATYKELLRVSGGFGDTVTASLVGRRDDVGSFSRALANDLLQAIKEKELFLEYQPQVDCRTGAVVGVEALLRWKHERIGRIPPSLFVALAEEIGFIGEVGLWVCDEACRQLRVWQDLGLTNTVMSVNVSVKQLEDPDLPEKIMACVARHDLDPRWVEVEVTESTGLSSDMGHNILLQEIRRKGINIAIDDFGMGHSSLVYLKHFPVATLKLDGSLVRDLTVDRTSGEIISTISDLCKSMDIHLLAEFVETEGQAEMLKQLGCYRFQGYLYSPPLAPEKCEQAIRNGFRTY